MKHILLTTIATLVVVRSATTQAPEQVVNIEALKQYLPAGTDGDGKRPLFSAAYFGRKKIGELLIAKGANANAKNTRGGTPLDFGSPIWYFPIEPRHAPCTRDV